MKAIEINPRNAKAYYIRGRFRQRIGDKSRACNDYKKAISLGSEITENWLKTARGAAWCRNM